MKDPIPSLGKIDTLRFSLDLVNFIALHQTFFQRQKNSSKLLSYLPTPPLGQDMTQGQFLSEV